MEEAFRLTVESGWAIFQDPGIRWDVLSCQVASRERVSPDWVKK
jgi:hypothetical protein